MEFVHAGVGKVRVDSFSVDNILEYIPRGKIPFKAEDRLKSIEKFNEDIIFAKSKSRSDTKAAERIIGILG